MCVMACDDDSRAQTPRGAPFAAPIRCCATWPAYCLASGIRRVETAAGSINDVVRELLKRRPRARNKSALSPNSVAFAGTRTGCVRNLLRCHGPRKFGNREALVTLADRNATKPLRDMPFNCLCERFLCGSGVCRQHEIINMSLRLSAKFRVRSIPVAFARHRDRQSRRLARAKGDAMSIQSNRDSSRQDVYSEITSQLWQHPDLALAQVEVAADAEPFGQHRDAGPAQV